MIGKNLAKSVYQKTLGPMVHRLFYRELISKTRNFDNVSWLGHPIWQDVTDLWVIQETISEVRPKLLIETGTNRGGSSLFYAHLFDLMGSGNIVTVDVEKLHTLCHPRITYLIGSSVEDAVMNVMRERAAKSGGPVMVILDSDHSRSHVLRELQCYSPLVTPGSFCLVQDGLVDVLPTLKAARPGPLPAIEEFLRTTDLFEVDEERCSKFIVTHHPKGWLRRRKNA